MTDRWSKVRHLCGGAALTAIVVGTFSCSSSALKSSSTLATLPGIVSTTATSTPTSQTVSPTTSANSSAPTTSTAPAPAVPVDGAALLQNALGAISAGYHFATTVTVDGATVLSAEGDRVADGTRLSVTQNSASVKYVITPVGTWVKPGDGDWQKLDTPAATTDPILALQSPTAVTVDSADPAATTLSVSVSAQSLGLTGDAQVVVAVAITGGSLRSVSYSTTIAGKAAAVQASIGAVVDGSPVVAPI